VHLSDLAEVMEILIEMTRLITVPMPPSHARDNRARGGVML
jgi:hypothetical protein